MKKIIILFNLYVSLGILKITYSYTSGPKAHLSKITLEGDSTNHKIMVFIAVKLTSYLTGGFVGSLSINVFKHWPVEVHQIRQSPS